MQSERDVINDRLKLARAELAKAEDAIQVAAAKATSSEVRQALTQAQSRVATVKAGTGEPEQLQDEQAKRLSTIREGILPAEVRSRRLFVGNLSYGVGEAELEQLLSRIGGVESVNVIRDTVTRQAGFALLEIASGQLLAWLLSSSTGRSSVDAL